MYEFIVYGNTIESGSSFSEGSSHAVNELTMYILMGLIKVSDDDDDFHLVAWWKTRESSFLVLFAVARDLLTEASTVASEGYLSGCR